MVVERGHGSVPRGGHCRGVQWKVRAGQASAPCRRSPRAPRLSTAAIRWSSAFSRWRVRWMAARARSSPRRPAISARWSMKRSRWALLLPPMRGRSIASRSSRVSPRGVRQAGDQAGDGQADVARHAGLVVRPMGLRLHGGEEIGHAGTVAPMAASATSVCRLAKTRVESVRRRRAMSERSAQRSPTSTPERSRRQSRETALAHVAEVVGRLRADLLVVEAEDRVVLAAFEGGKGRRARRDGRRSCCSATSAGGPPPAKRCPSPSRRASRRRGRRRGGPRSSG